MLTAQEIRTQRQQHNQSQADLAKSLGVEVKVIAGYESGIAAISNDHEEKLKKLWHPTPPIKPVPTAPPVQVTPVKPTPTTPTATAPVTAKPTLPPMPPVREAPAKDVAPDKQEAQPPKKADSTRAPSVTQWLEGIANDRPERPAKPAPTTSSNGNGNGRTASHSNGSSSANSSAAPVPNDQIIQAASQVTTDKQRRAALESLLAAASEQITTVFTEDKQVTATAEAIEKLQPAHKQIILGLIDQFEQIDPSKNAPPKGKLPAQDQILQTLKGQTPYETAMNYLSAAIQLLKQSDVADRTPLIVRLQGLNDFDRGTVNMMAKRYAETRRQEPKTDDKSS